MNHPQDRNLVFVSGKGGVGKSVLTEALARKSAAYGMRTWWVGMDGAGETEQIAPNLWKTDLSSEKALYEYMELKLGIPSLVRVFLNSAVIRSLSRAAPGVRELVLLGRIWFDRGRYERIYVDLPSTGYALAMFKSAQNFAQLFKGGPIHRDAMAILSTLEDSSQTGMLIVALPEEMPLQEGLEFRDSLKEVFPNNSPGWFINRCLPFDAAFSTTDSPTQVDSTIASAAEKIPLLSKSISDFCSHRVALEIFNRRIWDLEKIPYRILNRVHPSQSVVSGLQEQLNSGLTNLAPNLAKTLDPNAPPKGATGALGVVREKTARSLDKCRMIVTCGTGGVGKTTISAALAIRAALSGKRAVVITIDPARRLATSLGISGSSEQRVDLTERLLSVLKQSGADSPEIAKMGTLHAVIPDTRKSFQSFVERLAPNEQVATRIMKNPIFQIFAREFSGATDYVALERLHSLIQENEQTQGGKYDLIVLDTPPSHNTLEFLDSPRVLGEFFDEKVMKWLVEPTHRVLAGGMKKILGLLEKLTGDRFMTALVEFADTLMGARGRIISNLEIVTKALASNETGFVLVTSPSPDIANQADHWVNEFETKGLKYEGVILNRCLHLLEEAAREGTPLLSPSRRELIPAWTILAALAAQELPVVQKLGATLAALPEMSRDVHNMEDLLYVARSI